MTPHTPGPWRYWEARLATHQTREHRTMVLAPDGERLVCRLGEGTSGKIAMTPKEIEANGQLIAAAPDLLAALKGIIDQACDEGCPEFGEKLMKEHTDECREARAAIRKAEGDAS